MKPNARSNAPDWKEEILKRLADLRLAPPREAEIVEEIEQHLEDCYQELRARGSTDEEATRATLAELSDGDWLRGELRGVEWSIVAEPVVLGANRRSSMIARIWQDLRYGIRALLKSPGFTAVTLLTLALGIGVNTAIFSVVNAVLLRPFPFDRPERLLVIKETLGQGGTGPASGPNFLDWRAQQMTFDQMAVYLSDGLNLIGPTNTQRINSALVSGDFFQVFHMQAQKGRLFSLDELQPNASPVAIVSDSLWRNAFGGDLDLIGRSVNLSGGSYQIIGVMPAGFNFPGKTDIWLPEKFNDPFSRNRASHSFSCIGRLKNGATLEQAQAELSTIAGRLAGQYPASNARRGIRVISLPESVVRNVRTELLVFLIGVGFVLLIACGNVANLSMARATARQQEMAIRLSLGASRRRIFQQLLTESLICSTLSAALGLLIAALGLRWLLALVPVDNIPRLDQVKLDWRVLGFALTLAILTGVVFGLAPAWQAARTDLNLALKNSDRRTGISWGRGRRVLVISEIALALVLLIGGALMLQTFASLRRVDPGFSPHNVQTFGLFLPQMTTQEVLPRQQALTEILDDIQRLPGVTSAAVTAYLPFSGSSSNTDSMLIEGRPAPRPGDAPLIEQRSVSPNYFRTMSIPIINGRDFSAGDNEGSPPVAIVNQTMVQKFWPGQDVLDRRIAFDVINGKPVWVSIVGVVGDVHHFGLESGSAPEVYTPFRQVAPEVVAVFGPREPLSIVVHTTGPVANLTNSIVKKIQIRDKAQAVAKISSMDDLISASLGEPRLQFALLSLFGVLALVLAAAGVYSVLAYEITQRTHEIGLRLALGAQAQDILQLVLKQGMTVVLTGIAIGLAGAFLLMRFMTKLLFGVKPTDPLTFVAVPICLIIVALTACYLPARRATKVDPLVALRYE